MSNTLIIQVSASIPEWNFVSTNLTVESTLKLDNGSHLEKTLNPTSSFGIASEKEGDEMLVLD